MKTPWQHIYSFFGFWSYEEITMEERTYKCHRVIYWVMFPWKFKRKIDLIRLDRTPEYQKKLQRHYEMMKDEHNEQYNEGF